ncbi:hypothetical protein [Vibrio furnissii]|uniref:hypothetical protein n=1 Tax=Vibrio furnissii TaxID=29494 RepID=UPI000674D33C|nr:hypothetical protein [Vibrio furnissii]
MDLSKFSLADLQTPFGRRAFPNASINLQSDLAVGDYDAQLQRLHDDLDRIFSRISLHPIHREHDSEDRTSIEIVNLLRFLNHTAEHEASYGGNCDVCVNENDEFIWLGEAKIDYRNDHIMQGFRQLSDRYAKGDIRDGALLIYCKNNPSEKVLEDWKAFLQNKDNRSKEYGLTFTGSGHNYFFTEHLNRATGHIFTVKHIVISLLDTATDKSAVRRKKCSHSCEQCCKVLAP